LRVSSLRETAAFWARQPATKNTMAIKALLRAWRTIYLAHACCSSASPFVSSPAAVRCGVTTGSCASLIGDVRVLLGMMQAGCRSTAAYAKFGERRRSVLLSIRSRTGNSRLEPSRRLARGRVELALHTDVAARHWWAPVSSATWLQRRVALAAVPAARPPRRDRNAEVLPAAAKEHPPQGKHNPLQKARLYVHRLLGALSVATGFAMYKPTQLSWLTALFGGFQAARYWHFWAVWIFTASWSCTSSWCSSSIPHRCAR
jgi:hypothetical protein